MSNLTYSIVKTDGDSFVTVFVPGHDPLPASADHPNFDAIVQGALNDDPAVIELFDIASTVATRFDALSERVTVAHGRVYFDGDEVNSALTKQIVRFLDEGVDDWVPLVRFFEKVQANPNEHSREQLYEWLDRHEFTLTPSGDFVGYKGVQSDGKGGYQSISSGPATVDGVSVNGNVPNNIGSVVEMPRGLVAHDPSQGCRSGLHVGTWDYASGFSRGAVLEVHVNPRDVVSVPTDCGWAKVRTCRYTVVGVTEVAYSAAVLVGFAGSLGDEDGIDLDPEGWF